MKILFVILLFGVSLSLKAQKNLDNKGFYDAKFFITLEGQANSPLIYNLRTASTYPEYSRFDKNLNEKKDKFNYGFRISGNYLIKRNTAIGIETGFDYASIYPPKNYTDDLQSSSISLLSEALDIKTFVIMPKIELSTKNALLPLGLSHQIGIGIAKTSIVEKNYNFLVIDNYGNSLVYNSIYKDKLYNYSNNSFKNYLVMYALSMRTAITKNILINYGFRYTFNLPVSSNGFSESDAQYFLQQNTIYESVKKQRSSSLINFNLGLTYAF